MMSSALRLLAVFAVISFGSGVFGLKCWTCEKAISNEACNAMGSVQTCSANQACLNRVITSQDGSRYEINKGCRKKARSICRSADPQNYGVYPTKCQFNKRGSVCQCCCDTDLCNGPQTECKDAVTCKKLDNPGNGRVTCPRRVNYGRKCFVKCNRGFKREGPRVVTCTNGTEQGYWSPKESIACLAKATVTKVMRKSTICEEQMKAPAHGSIVCENRWENRDSDANNHVGTMCAFKCDVGYFLNGPESTQCLHGGRWSIKPPKCIKGMCQTPLQDKNRVDQCTDGRYFGSVCSVQCREGYKLLGASETTCNSVNDNIRQGAWSSDFPRCIKAMCRPQLMKPTNGEMRCTKKSLLGSVCSFSCREGYDLTDIGMSDRGTVECVENGENVEWNGSPPKCTRVMCPRLEMPQNGNVACIGDGSLESRCIFSCKVGFDLVGSSEPTQETVCRNGGARDGVGVWTLESVTCTPVKCEPERSAPSNGAVYCTKGNEMGSVCTFTCNPEYDMDGTTSRLLINTCEGDDAGDGRGKWSANPATCSTRYFCKETQTDPQHGTVSCDNESYLGSVCQFACEEGYEIKGIDRITCADLKNDGDSEVEWNSPAPVCIPSTCPEQWYDTTTVRVRCNPGKEGNSYPVGTRCVYECNNHGLYLEQDESGDPVEEISCIAKNTWSRQAAPRCYPKTCPRLEKILNGNQPDCTNGYRYQSRCRYKCDEKYTPTHNEPIVCEDGGTNEKVGYWDKEPPQCILNECLATPSNPSKGTVTCSSGAKVGSYCTLECDRGYAPKIARIDCQMTPDTVDGESVEVPKFLQMNNFCCAQCRSDFQIVLAVDARFNRALQNVIDFAKIFLAQLAGQENQAYVSSFAYGEEIDESTVIESTAVTAESVSEVAEKMNAWEIEEEGKNSDTRAALDFASDTMFSSLDSNAASFLILAADDSPENVNAGALSKIKERGINAIVAAGNNFAKIKWEKLMGGSENVVNQDSNEIMKRIYDLAFANGCSNMAPECV